MGERVSFLLLLEEWVQCRAEWEGKTTPPTLPLPSLAAVISPALAEKE